MMPYPEVISKRNYFERRRAQFKRSASDILFEQLYECTDDCARALIIKPRPGIAKHKSTPLHLRKPYKTPPTALSSFGSYKLADAVAKITERVTGDRCFVEQTSRTVYVVYRREPGGKLVRA